MKDRLELIFRRAQALLQIACRSFRLAAFRLMRAAARVRVFGALPGRNRLFARSLQSRSLQSRRHTEIVVVWVAEVQMLESRTLLSAIDPSQIAATSMVTFHGALSQRNELVLAIVDGLVNFKGDDGLCEFDILFGRLPYHRATQADAGMEIRASPAVGKFLGVPQWPGKKSLSPTPGEWPDAPAVPLRWAA